MNKEKYEKLKSVIQIAVSGIMDLKFGCKLKEIETGVTIIMTSPPRWNGIRDEFTYIYKEYPSHTGAYRYDSGIDNKHLEEIKKKYKILGRPITVADVLMAINKKGIKEGERIFWRFGYKCDLAITTGGLFTKYRAKDAFFRTQETNFDKKMDLKYQWNLKHDLDWHYQNKPETCEFLYNIWAK